MLSPAPPRTLRCCLRWAPAAVLGALLLPSWVLFYSGGMRAVWGWQLLVSAGQLLGPLTILVVLIQAIRKRRFSRPMQAAAGLAFFSLWPALWMFGVSPIAFPSTVGSTRPAATVRLPANGPVRVLWGGDRVAANRHAVFPDQRWAYDLSMEPAMHGSSKLEDYGCYGKSVVAPADARVHDAVDGLPDGEPGELNANFTEPFGNHVVLALETGTYLVIAHMKPGSVAVHPGDAAKEGQPIGACGNSGNTSEPHIHIHHQRQDPKGRPINFSEGLPLFFRDHDGPQMPEGGLEVRNDKVILKGAVVTHRGPR